MTRDGLRTGSKSMRKNDDFKYNTALRAVFHKKEANKLTEEATEVCQILNIKPEDLCHKGLDFFTKDNGQKIQKEIAEVRFRHF